VNSARSRTEALIGTAAFLIVPVAVAGLVPYLLSGWRVGSSTVVPAVRAAGVPFIAVGAVALLSSFVRFAIQGLGTPAPIAPTATLVVSGLYGHVRNPMYLAVSVTVVGQGILLASWVLAYSAALLALFHCFGRRDW
jgi:protein-S-isoprenylcysteine O-methyltransferase Ste14